jgi:addiction module HigA family antidote
LRVQKRVGTSVALRCIRARCWLALSINALALDLHVPVTRVSEIVNERRGITADTALRLGRYFGTSANFWMNLQKDYELTLTRQKSLKTIERQVRRRSAA